MPFSRADLLSVNYLVLDYSGLHLDGCNSHKFLKLHPDRFTANCMCLITRLGKQGSFSTARYPLLTWYFSAQRSHKILVLLLVQMVIAITNVRVHPPKLDSSSEEL